ncbi:MAG: PAS domain S-box protein, partial [Bacteroidota bacterium]|nr:PAS domain S-box protein [Bacteroidota bacterium]
MNNKITFDFDFFNNLKEMCFLLNGKGIVKDVNSITIEKMNTSKEHLIGKHFTDLIEQTDRNEVQELLNLPIIKNTSHELEFRIKYSNYTFITESTIISSRQNNSVLNSFVVISKDLTQQKIKEQELRRFVYVAEHTVNPMQITDLDGKMIYVNPAFVAASGYERDELIGQRPSIFKSGRHSKKFWAKMWNTINSGKTWFGEVENKKKNGEPYHTQLLISPILSEDGKVTGFFGLHRDLSDRRILERQLIHTQKMESIGTLAAGIAHEVGNPLASISAIVQVVQRSTEDEFVKEKLSLVKNQVTRISKIIRDLVDFSRPSNYELKVTDINANIIEAVEITKVGSKAKDIIFSLDLNKEIPSLPLIADQLQQIFVNILLNAVDAINERANKYIQAEIKVKTYISNEEVVIIFSDNGAGIP